MPKDKKGQIYYQVTHDKPEGVSHVLMIGGAVGSALSFFVVSVMGALSGTEMNDWVFYFILSALIGFFVGASLTWVFVRYFAKVVSATSAVSAEAPMASAAPPQAAAVDGPSPVAAQAEEDKGQSVDFVFPELTPDK